MSRETALVPSVTYEGLSEVERSLTLWAVRSDDMLGACSRWALASLWTTPARPAHPQTILGAREDCHQ